MFPNKETPIIDRIKKRYPVVELHLMQKEEITHPHYPTLFAKRGARSTLAGNIFPNTVIPRRLQSPRRHDIIHLQIRENLNGHINKYSAAS